MNKEFDFKYASFNKLASSWTVDGGVNNKYLVWIADYEDSEEKEFYVLDNIAYPDREDNYYVDNYCGEEKYVIKFSYVGPWRREKTFHAISRSGKYVCAAYTSKYGVRCYDSDTEGLRWENKKIRSIESIKFNRFDDKILEVWHKNAEVTYIDVEKGAVIEAENYGCILQQSGYIRTSENQKYVIIADNRIVKNFNRAMYSVYEIETNKLLGRFAGIFSMSTDFGLTNDGKYAFISEYERYGISMVEVSTKETVWNNKTATHLRQIVIKEKENEIIAVGNYKANKVLAMDSGIMKENKYAKQGMIFPNKYGPDIIVDEDKAYIGYDAKAVSVDAFLYALGTPAGFAVNVAGNQDGLRFFDYNGKLLWENRHKGLGLANLAYVEKYNTICGFTMVRDIRKIWLIDVDNGNIIKEIAADNSVEAFIDNNCKLLCSTGMIYDILQDDIVKEEEGFKFTIV